MCVCNNQFNVPQAARHLPFLWKKCHSDSLLTCTINSPTLPVRLAVADGEVCAETLYQCPALLYGDRGVHALCAHQACHHGLLPALCPLCDRERPAAKHFNSSTKHLFPSHSHSPFWECPIWECDSVCDSVLVSQTLSPFFARWFSGFGLFVLWCCKADLLSHKTLQGLPLLFFLMLISMNA